MMPMSTEDPNRWHCIGCLVEAYLDEEITFSKLIEEIHLEWYDTEDQHELVIDIREVVTNKDLSPQEIWTKIEALLA